MRQCMVNECDSKHWAKGYCSKHYYRLVHNGTLTTKIHRHNLAKTKLYSVWSVMKQRCNNPNNINYDKYGGRGITVCDEWLHDFKAFHDYMGNKPTPQHSLDRIDNNGNYEPGNVRWASKSEQDINRRTRNKYGYPGIYKYRTKSGIKWIGRLRNGNKLLSTKSQTTKQQAISQRKQLELKVRRTIR